MRKIRGRCLEIAEPNTQERAWICEALSKPENHVAIGCRQAPTQAEIDAGVLRLFRGEHFRDEAVRFFVLRRLGDARAVGFFLDFGWDYPTDSTREVDLVFPNPADRGLASYLDATVLIGHFLFANGLAKRIRWRVDATGCNARRSNRQGARFLRAFEERHPVTGEWVTKHIYEFAFADYETLVRDAGVDPSKDYQDISESVWEFYRRR